MDKDKIHSGLEAVEFNDVRDLAMRMVRPADGKSIALIQSALIFAYVAVADALHDLPDDHKSGYMSAMIAQGLGALPPVIEAVRAMTPDQLKLATMPVEGTS